MDESMDKFIESLRLQGRTGTATSYALSLTQYDGWLRLRRLEPLHATPDDLREYQRWLSDEYRSPSGRALGRATQATRISAVKAFHAWLARKGILLSDPARDVELPKVPKTVTTKDYLSLQEAQALLQTQAERMEKAKKGTLTWARESRNLALIALALATGKRRSSLRALKVSDLNFVRDEVRVEKEKGKSGAVFPCARWAMATAKQYVEEARPVLLRAAKDEGWLFLAWRGARRIGVERFAMILESLVRETIEKNPDLEELPDKNITPHSLRVTFATLLFANGCNIRSINELMMHEKLSTTALYTPIPLEDLRRACRAAHPRA
jgi:integrase/recombinase XerD